MYFEFNRQLQGCSTISFVGADCGRYMYAETLDAQWKAYIHKSSTHPAHIASVIYITVKYARDCYLPHLIPGQWLRSLFGGLVSDSLLTATIVPWLCAWFWFTEMADVVGLAWSQCVCWSLLQCSWWEETLNKILALKGKVVSLNIHYWFKLILPFNQLWLRFWKLLIHVHVYTY